MSISRCAERGLLIARMRAPLAAWPVALGSLAIVFSYLARARHESANARAADFTRAVLAQVKPEEQLALVAYKEQFLLYLDRPTVNFGHRRWLEGPQESYDAAAWLNAEPNRVLLVPESTTSRHPCFLVHGRRTAGRSFRRRLVPGARAGGSRLRRPGAMHRGRSHTPPSRADDARVIHCSKISISDCEAILSMHACT